MAKSVPKEKAAGNVDAEAASERSRREAPTATRERRRHSRPRSEPDGNGWASLESTAGRIAFRYVPTDERLALEQQNRGWELRWRDERRALSAGELIETSDRVQWLVQPPHAGGLGIRHIPRPRRTQPGLSRVLFDAWYETTHVYGAPELAHEKDQAAKLVQIFGALREAIRRRGVGSAKLLEAMETKARGYLGNLGPDEDEPPHVRRERLRAGPVARRPAAAEELAEHWLPFPPCWAPPADQAPEDQEKARAEARGDAQARAEVIASKFIRHLREGSYYAEIAAELPRLKSAGAAETEELARAYDDACDSIQGQRRLQLCEACEREALTLAAEGECKNPKRCRPGVREIAKEERRAAETLTRTALGILGMTAARRKSLFDATRKAKPEAR